MDDENTIPHTHPMTLLILDDDQWIRRELEEFFQGREEFVVHVSAMPSQAFKLLERHRPDIFILDIKLPEMDGLTLLEKVKPMYPDMEVIMITGHGDLESAVKALRSGASDYLTKPFRLHEIDLAIERTGKFLAMAKKVKQMENAHDILNKEIQKRMGYPLISASDAMNSVVALMDKVAQANDTSVMISGESGTGKELVARGIHYLSQRKNSLFCAVNTSAVTESIFESEFFGHKKGAFTHAVNKRQGWFETAHTGTLFLDEVSEMPLSSQSKLLRVLEERRITRVGEQKSIPVDIRVITATNRDMQKHLQEGKFRTDLYYRLNTFSIHVPSLRERREDIPLLVDHYVQLFANKMNKKIKRISSDLFSAFDQYGFPGNVRELKNMVERAVILCDDANLSLRHFPGLSTSGSSLPHASRPKGFDPVTDLSSSPGANPAILSDVSSSSYSSDEIDTLDNLPSGSGDSAHNPTNALLSYSEEITDLDKELLQIEKEIILSALEHHKQNKSKAAAALGISRQSLYRRLSKFEM